MNIQIQIITKEEHLIDQKKVNLAQLFKEDNLKVENDEIETKEGELGFVTSNFLNIALNSATLVISIKNIASCIKTYLQEHSKDMIRIKKGDFEIEFPSKRLSEIEALIQILLEK